MDKKEVEVLKRARESFFVRRDRSLDEYASFVSAILFGSSKRCAPAGTRATAGRTRGREVLNHTCAKCAKLAIRHRGEQHQERARF